ncbi:MAG: putative type-1 restriction enzyme specificity protein MG438 [Synergistaceae bacterium]|nr:restriction endonuclease subunit S [Synergistaceae bacterium]
MSKLEELINELCPDGVEYIRLGNMTKILRGKRLIKSQLSYNEKYPVFHGGLEPLGYYGESNRKANTVMVINVGASAGTVGYSNVEFWSSDGCFCLEHSTSIINRYAYYALLSCEKLLRSKVRFAGIPTLDNKVVEDVKFPLPPLPVQHEIVRILDNFTLLTAELTAELTERKKQYEYYRDFLFDFSDDVPRVKLVDITDISRGVRVVKKQLIPNGKYPVYQNCLTAMGYYDKHNCDADTTYVISAGAAGEIGFCDKDFWAADDCLIFSNLNGVINKYIYYFLTTKQDFIRSNVRRASIPRLSRRVIENLQIPFVSLEEQERIVAILDRFDTLCNDLTSGLPAEIEARRKQYEYYRDRILTFKEKVA